MERWMADIKRFGIERRKGVCAKGWSIESRDNPVASWCTSSRI